MSTVSMISLIVLFFVSLLSVASASIGIQSLNKHNKTVKEEDKSVWNLSFEVFILIMSIMALIASLVIGFFSRHTVKSRMSGYAKGLMSDDV